MQRNAPDLPQEKPESPQFNLDNYSLSEEGSDELRDQVDLENGPIGPIKGQPIKMNFLRFNSLANPSPKTKGQSTPNRKFATQKTG